jgi:hypothetical protein
MHHPHSGRWVSNLDTDENLLAKYRQEDPDPDYEMDQDHQQQQHMPSMQAPIAQHESQTHANLQQHPPITSVSAQPESMSPATRPGGIRTGIFYPQLVEIFSSNHGNYRKKREASWK